MEAPNERDIGGGLRSTVGEVKPRLVSAMGAGAPTRGDARIWRIMLSVDLVRCGGRSGGGGRESEGLAADGMGIGVNVELSVPVLVELVAGGCVLVEEFSDSLVSSRGDFTSGSKSGDAITATDGTSSFSVDSAMVGRAGLFGDDGADEGRMKESSGACSARGEGGGEKWHSFSRYI